MNQAIKTKWIGPTNFRPSRVRAYYAGGSITCLWDYELGVDDNHRAAALRLADKLGWLEFGDFIGGFYKNEGFFVRIPKKPKKERQKLKKTETKTKEKMK
jgi:hypothetical protein